MTLALVLSFVLLNRYEGHLKLNPCKPGNLFCGTEANSADTDQLLQNVASDQGLHCLLT